MSHTPLPWATEQISEDDPRFAIHGPNGFFHVVAITSQGNDAENAAHIVRCVNHHDELVAALAEVSGYMCHCDNDVDKESGELPPETNAKNSWGEPVWRNEVCQFCRARLLIAKATGKPN